MSIISQETWDNMPKEEKKEIIKAYRNDLKKEDMSFFEGCVETFKQLFGKENLQSEVITEKCVEPMKEYIDKETQNYKWSQLSEDDKDYYQVLYADPNTRKVIKECLIRAWGEHNLQPNKIRTWKDVERHFEDSTYIETSDGMINEDYRITLSDDFNNKVINKAIATLQISKLIELGYGGMVTEEEWNDEDIPKYSVLPQEWMGNDFEVIEVYFKQRMNFISFHTKQQAQEFMSHESNRKLVEQYNMI